MLIFSKLLTLVKEPYGNNTEKTVAKLEVKLDVKLEFSQLVKPNDK